MHDSSATALVLDTGSMDSMMRLAEIMAKGRWTMPKEYNDSPGDCLAVIMQSMQWKMNPYAVAQKTHFVGGKIGYEAQLINAVITSMAPTKDRLHYEWLGDWEKILGKFKELESKSKKDDFGRAVKYRVPDWDLNDEAGLGIRVWATLKGEDEPRELVLLMAQARTRNSTLWADDPRQQLAYLATKRWARLYTPDIILGVYSPDELEEPPPPASKHMGDAQVIHTDKPELPSYSEEQFAKNLPAWKELIASGKKTPDRIIATVQSKALLSDSQKDQIRALAAATVIDAATGEVHQPVHDIHPLESQMNGAEDEDTLCLLADQIRSIDNEATAQHLRGIYQANLDRLNRR
jgi:hypothetical protein